MAFFSKPAEFHRRLQDLLSLYANRALRFGESAGIKPLIPMYRLPAPVTRQLQADLHLQIEADPDAALSLADELWQDTYYEIKNTALFILGDVSTQDPGPIIARLKAWITPDLDAKLLTDLFSTGVVKIQAFYPDSWEKLIQPLLETENSERLSLGIKALLAGVQNTQFTNLPAIYRLVGPLLYDPDRKLLNDLSRLIEALAKESPVETGFFLRQTLSLSTSPETQRLVKQCLPFFPEAIAAELKSLLAR